MAIKQMYDIIETGYTITGLLRENVGATQVNLPMRLFYEDGISITHLGTNDSLTPDHYALSDLDQPLTNLFGKNVYKKLFITDIGYQTGQLSIDFVGVGDMMLATDMYELQSQIDTKLPIVGGAIEGNVTVRDILPNMVGATGIVSVRNIGSPTAKFNSVYADEVFVGASSLYVNGKKVIEDVSDTMTLQTDEDQGMVVKTVASIPGSGNANLTIQAGNEINMVGRGGIEVTVPTGVANKNLVISNVSTNGEVQVTSANGITINAATSVDITGTINAADLVLSGNLTVQGTTTTLDTQTLLIEDNIIELNKNQTGTPAGTLVAGITVNRGDSNDYRFVFRESDDTFRVGENGLEQAVATRQDAPAANGVAFWDSASNKFNTFSGLTYDGTNMNIAGNIVFGANSTLRDANNNVLVTAVEADGYSMFRCSNTLDTGAAIAIYRSDATANANKVKMYGSVTIQGNAGGGDGSLSVSGEITSLSRRVVTVASGTTFPSNVGLGDECYRTDLDEWYKYNGSVWTQI